MRSLYKGVLGFGLVSVPVDLYKALESEATPLHWVHRVCGHRIRYQKFCPVCQRALEGEAGEQELAKAATLPDGRVVMLEGEPPAPAVSDRTITIVGFHRSTEVDPVYYRDAYWLRPGAGGQKAYRLLAAAMRSEERVAMAEMHWHGRAQWTVVRPFGETALMLHTMHAPASLRQEGMHFGEGEVALSDKEQRLAALLVREMSEPFVAEHYPNRAGQALWERIQAAAQNARMPAPTPPAAGVIDLMEALRASLGQAADPAAPVGAAVGAKPANGRAPRRSKSR